MAHRPGACLVACRTMTALWGGPYYAGSLRPGGSGVRLKGTGPLQHSLLTGAMDILCGVTSSPALGVGNFWKALDSLLCWLTSGIRSHGSAHAFALQSDPCSLSLDPNLPNCPSPDARLVFAKRVSSLIIRTSKEWGLG